MISWMKFWYTYNKHGDIFNIVIKEGVMDKGYIQLYTGNDKGKTTAAFGLAVRAACAGKSVYSAKYKTNTGQKARIRHLSRDIF